MLRVLTECSGSVIAAYLIKSIREAGFEAVASDVADDCFGKHLADDYLMMLRANDPGLWDFLEEAVERERIGMVIPSFDETLMGWAERKERFAKNGACVVLSDPEALRIFQDKWLTYEFFHENGIPTPATSLEQEYPLVKPRFGRGGQGVSVVEPGVTVDMAGMISQELLEGVEFTVDILCDRDGVPVYIVPRRRLTVREGKSIDGIVDEDERVVDLVRLILSKTTFQGPINAQCFICPDGRVLCHEINPRIAGGMALGFAATENWMPLLARHFIEGKAIEPVAVRNGTKMMRYYAEVFVPGD